MLEDCVDNWMKGELKPLVESFFIKVQSVWPCGVYLMLKSRYWDIV